MRRMQSHWHSGVHTGGEFSGWVEVYDTKTYTQTKKSPAEAGAGDLLVSADALYVSVNNAFGSSTTVVDPISLMPTQVRLSGPPRNPAVEVGPEGATGRIEIAEYDDVTLEVGRVIRNGGGSR